MRWPFAGGEDRHLIDGERVYCRLEGRDVDTERCLACVRLERYVGDGQAYIVCRPPSRGLPEIAA